MSNLQFPITHSPPGSANPDELRCQLAALIKDRALGLGEFTLSSGQKSTYYIDGKQITFDPRGAWLVAELILDRLEDVEYEAVGGLDMGATPMASAVALRSYERGRPVLGFTVRKQEKGHGTGQRIEGPIAQGPSRVVLMDDVLTTGGSILQAAQVLHQRGDEVVRAISIVDREGGAEQLLADHEIPYESLLKPGDLGVDLQ